MAIFGLPRLRTELARLLVVASLTKHPLQANRQAVCHSDLGDLSPSPHQEYRGRPDGPVLFAKLQSLHRAQCRSFKVLSPSSTKYTPCPDTAVRPNKTPAPAGSRSVVAT